MSELKAKKTKTVENRGRRRGLTAAVSAFVALAAILAAFLACKNVVFYSFAKSKAEKNEFSAASKRLEKSDGEKSEALAEYVKLRIEINESYPAALSRFEADKITDWLQTASVLAEKEKFLGNKIYPEVLRLKNALSVIENLYVRYEAARPSILALMDVFDEVNRLNRKGADGKNAAFTVAEERAKLSKWKSENEALALFASKIPNGKRVYLLDYLIKEVQGECSDIEAAADSIIENGYSETDRVRFSGEAQRSFPDIVNENGESVNLLEKEKYEEYLKKGVCRALIESLGIFFIP